MCQFTDRRDMSDINIDLTVDCSSSDKISSDEAGESYSITPKAVELLSDSEDEVKHKPKQ